MSKITVNDGPHKTFVAHTPANLIGKEDNLVQLRSDGLIEVWTSGQVLGVLAQRLEGDEGAWNVRLIGKGGSVRMIQDGAIVPGGFVKAKSGGRVETSSGDGTVIGIKVGPATNGAQNDVIEVVDFVYNTIDGVLVSQATPGALGGSLTGTTDGDLADVADIELATANTYTDVAVNAAVNAAILSTNLQLKELQEKLNTVIAALGTAGVFTG